MLQQPRPDYIVKPMPATIPAFEIAPLERARTDRAANDQYAEREFATDGESRLNVPMLLCAIVMGVAFAAMIIGACYGLFQAAVAAIAVTTANPAEVGYGAAGTLAVVLCTLIALRVRAAHAARTEAHPDTQFGELA